MQTYTLLDGLLTVAVQEGSGWLDSDLKLACPVCGGADCYAGCGEGHPNKAETPDAIRARLTHNRFIDGLESLVLACACAGVEVSSPAFGKVLEAALAAAEAGDSPLASHPVRSITLPGEIVINMDETGALSLSSNQKEPCPGCGEVECYGDCGEENPEEMRARLECNRMVDGMQTLLLACAREGIDLNRPEFEGAVVSTLDAIANCF